MDKFAQLIKEVHWPKVSDKLRQEVELQKQSVRSQNVKRSAANLRSGYTTHRLEPIQSNRTSDKLKRLY